MMANAVCFSSIATLLLLHLVTIHGAPISLGSFRSRQHQLQGTVTLLSERVIEVTGFIYDGTAPAAYFWIDTSAVPSRNGRRLLDATPSNSCGKVTLPRGTGGTFIVEFPLDFSIQNYLGGSFSVWCEAFSANFGEVVIPATLSGLTTTASGPNLLCSVPVPVPISLPIPVPVPVQVPVPISLPFPVPMTALAPISAPAIPSPVSAPVTTTAPFSVPVVGPITANVPKIAQTPAGFNCEPLNSQYQVRWAVMGNEIAVELVGLVSETDWMGFGVSGSTTRTFMLGADPTIVDTYNGSYRARDFYLNNRSQCSGVSGVCPDTRNGKTEDVKIVFGERDQGITLVRYIRPLTPTDVNDSLPSDSRIDRSISVASGVSTYIVWAIGPVSPDTGLPQFHSVYPRGIDFKLEFGRKVTDNCVPLVSKVEVTPPVPYQIPVLKDVTEIVARIGPSGGDRGYSAITNTVSWGIAWYMNDLLIPVIEMRRGTKYTFRISGGNTPDSNSEFHPMYLTTSASGGYAQMSPEERAQQTILAGITVTQRDSNGNVIGYESPLQAPICQYQVSDATFLLAKSATFQDYYNTLDRSCAANSLVTNAAFVFEFTPTQDTPDIIYYQCVTHRNLGWKINVLDAVPSPLIPTVNPAMPTFPVPVPLSTPVSSPIIQPPTQEENQACGLFGLRIFCFRQQCGFIRRLLGLGGC